MNSALITGISGQDGSLLAKYLLNKGYEVYAIAHHDLDEKDVKFQNYKDFYKDIKWSVIDLSEREKLDRFIKISKPNEVYHLGAQSFPATGFDQNYSSFQSNTLGVYNLLASTFYTNQAAKFFFAGSAEMFGDNVNLLMDENELFRPKTMYGISKLVGHELIRNYRDNLQKFTVTGILFNHESPHRGEEFVTRKISLAAAKIKLGLQKELILGSLKTKRDWSAAEDFVEGFHLALNAPVAQDYVFASGELHTIEEFVNIAFSHFGLNYHDYVRLDERFNRPSRYDLVGNPTRAKTILKWNSKFCFEEIVIRMVESDYNRLKFSM